MASRERNDMAATTAKRADIHRPAAFDPTDYQVIDYLDNKRPEPPLPGPRGISADASAAYEAAVALWQRRIFEHFPDWRTDGEDHRSIFQCNHCGHPGIRWVAVVEHIPTGDRLAFGEICAERCDLPGRSAFQAKFIKDRAAREQAAYENQMRRAAFRETAADVVEFLDALEKPEWGWDHNDFLQSLRSQLDNKGELSERQVEAVRKSIVRARERNERIAAERVALADAPPLAEGRRVIEGEVVSVKHTDGAYGPQTKLLIREDDGNKVYGTAPRNLEELMIDRIVHPDPDDFNVIDHVAGIDLRGKRVRLVVTVERSRDDEHFGFYKRPTKAEVVAKPHPDLDKPRYVG